MCSEQIPQEYQVHRSNIKIEQCTSNGLMFSYKVAGGRCSNFQDCESEFDRRLICSMSYLFDDSKHSDGFQLQIQPDSKILYAYTGFSNSFFISYPFYHYQYTCSGYCKNYDPRIRPWYTGTATGTKNVVIMADFSGSMYGLKIESVKAGVKSILNSLRQFDWFQIIIFSDQAIQYEGSYLMQATSKNISKFIEILDEITIEQLQEDKNLNYQYTNIEMAFKQVFSLISRSKISSYIGENCQTNIILFSDGYISQGMSNETEILNYIKILNTPDIDASIITYSIGEKSTDSLLQKISCQNKGIWDKIDIFKDNVEEVLQSFSQVTTQGIKKEGVQWSEIYQDFQINKEVITASTPIYYDDSNGIERLLGVFAADILTQDLEQYYDFRSTVYPEITNSLQICSGRDLDNCKLKSFQKQVCNEAECPNYTQISQSNICETDSQYHIKQSWRETSKGTKTDKYSFYKMEIQDVHHKNLYESVISEMTQTLENDQYLGKIKIDKQDIQDIHDSLIDKMQNHYDSNIFYEDIKQINFNYKKPEFLEDQILKKDKKKKKKQKKEQKKPKLPKLKNFKEEDIIYQTDEDLSYNHDSYNSLQKKEDKSKQQNELNQSYEQNQDQDEDDETGFNLFEMIQKKQEQQIKQEQDIENMIIEQQKQINDKKSQKSDSDSNINITTDSDINDYIIKESNFTTIPNVILAKFSENCQTTNRKTQNRKYIIKLHNAWCCINKKEFFVNKMDLQVEESDIISNKKVKLNNNINNENCEKQIEMMDNENEEKGQTDIKDTESSTTKSNIGKIGYLGNVKQQQVYMCQICQKVFKVFRQLTQHQKLQHFTLAYGTNHYIYSQMNQQQYQQQQQLQINQSQKNIQ